MKRSPHQLAPVAKDYFELLKSESATILDAEAWDLQRAELIKRWKAVRNEIEEALTGTCEISLIKVFEYEDLQIKVMSDQRIRAKAWSARESYSEIVSKPMLQAYTATNPPDLKDPASDIKRIRADVEDLTFGLHWWYVNASRKERALRRLKRILLTIVLAGLAVVLTLTSGLAIETGGIRDFLDALAPLEMIVYVMYAGLLGATVSTVRRIQPVADQPIASPDPLLKSMALEEGNLGILLSVLLGGIFALVLYLLFAAGLADQLGASAPKLGTPDHPPGCSSASWMYTSLCHALPLTPVDFAKAMAWSFVAGFSERLVPDMIDRLQNGKSK